MSSIRVTGTCGVTDSYSAVTGASHRTHACPHLPWASQLHAPPPRLTSGSGVREDSSPEAPLVGILAWKCLGPRTFREPDSEAVVPDPARLLCSPRVASQAPGRPCLAAPGPGSVPSSLSALHAQATD